MERGSEEQKGDEEEVSEGDREKEEGKAVTQEMKTGWCRERALDGGIGMGWRVVVGDSSSARYENNNSVGTQVEYFSNIIAGELLSATVISFGCIAEPSLLLRGQMAHGAVPFFFSDVLKAK